MELKSEYQIIKKLGQLSEESVLIFDLDSRKFSYYNEHFLELTGLTKKQIDKDPLVILERIVPEDLEYVRNRYQEFLRDKLVSNSEFRIDNGKKRFYVSCDAIIVEEDGIIIFLLKDISAQRIHQDFAVNYGAQKDTLLDMLIHNLNGPLLVTREIIDNSKENGFNDHQSLSKMLSLIRENTQQCIDIVNDFLREEHHDSIRTIIKAIRFDVIEKINVTIEKLQALNKEKTIAVKNQSQKIVITADAVKFFQVIHNIVSNSIKYTPPDGRIEVDVKESKDHITICIKDNGIGIPAGMKDKLFVGPVESRPGVSGETSSGIGLHIAKQLIDKMRGEIWFESEENKGSSFFVKLPKEFGRV